MEQTEADRLRLLGEAAQGRLPGSPTVGNGSPVAVTAGGTLRRDDVGAQAAPRSALAPLRRREAAPSPDPALLAATSGVRLSAATWRVLSELGLQDSVARRPLWRTVP
jgi:hypothetical protein